MKCRWPSGWILLIVTNVLFCGVLSFYQPTSAAPPARKRGEPFANSVTQRGEMITELKAIRALLQEQNALLRSGQLKVIVGNAPAETK